MTDVANEFDLGPLTWVKAEIDLALERAGAALDAHVAEGDATQLRFCRTHIHQVHGALAIVGLDGVTQVTESLEALLSALEEGRISGDETALGAVRRAIAGLHVYLDELMAGEPNQPLRLQSVYLDLAAARGLKAAQPSDLFFPDLTRRPPKRPAQGPALDPALLRTSLRQERMRFQKGLLAWLKKPQDAEAGRQAMREALAGIEATQETPAARTFWRAAMALLEAMSDPTLGGTAEVRQIVARFDAQIRRLVDGSGGLAERLMREALFHVARAPAEAGPMVAEVQKTFALPALLPTAGAVAEAAPEEAVLRRLREALGAAEELWAKVCGGSLGHLAGFAEQARNIAALTSEVGLTDLKRLGQGLGNIAGWLVEDNSRYADTVAMEVATAILLLQNAQENFKRLGADFAQQVDHMVARLHACIAGRPAADEAVPLLDEMTRRAQEKLLISQVAREIQNNLAQVEQSLDAFFRDPAKGHDLTLLDVPLKQIAGALAMLGHMGAVQSLRQCGEQIRRFAEPGGEPTAEDFEAVASQLSMLGFFVDALPGGEKDFAAFVRRMQGETPADDEETEIAEALPEQSVEDQLAQQARDTHALAEALREAPQDERLQEELKQNLQAIQKDADLVANHELGETAKAALEALEAGAPGSVEVDAALSGLKPQQPDVPAPSAETLQLADASHEEIDAELLAIFLEEARDVLATIGEQAAVLAADSHDIEALTVVRRSTHTLKGSGRMVGLKDLGEAAWELEQTYNLWLRQEQPVTPELQGLIDGEHALFSTWVAHLESGQGKAPDPSALVALAARLRGQEPLPLDGPLAAPAAPIAEAPAVQVELPAPDAADEAPSLVLDLPEIDDLPAEPAADPAFDPHLQAAADALEDLLVAEDLPAAAEPAAAPASPTLYDIFREEAKGHLKTLVDSLAEIEANPSMPTTFEMTRAAHTLGGIAGTVGLMPLHHLAIALEHALLRRDGSVHPASIEGLETVRQTIGALDDMFAGLALQAAPEEQPQLIAALEDIYPLAEAVLPEAETDAEPVPVSAEIIPLPGRKLERVADSEPETGEVPVPLPELPLLNDDLDEQLLPIFLEEAADQLRELTSSLRNWRADLGGDAAPHAIARLLHTFKGNARMAGAMNLGEVTHLLETRVEEAMHAGPATSAFVDEIEAGCDALAQAVERLRSGPVEAVAATPASTGEVAPVAVPMAGEAEVEADANAQRATLRVRADLVDRLVNEAGELSIARTRIEGEMRSLKGSLLDLTENVIRLRRQLREIEIQAETQIQARVAQTPDGQAEFDPLELDRFTRFQELTRFMAESVNDVATVQQNLLKNLDDANAAILAQSRLNRGLQQELMGIRMVPFASQAERLYRIVRQTAKEVGKRANLDIVGGQVEIDRSVLDKMLAPIEHMLRNAVTHGIESREQRVAEGKPEAGDIRLALAQEGNEIILSMHDDGHGLDAGRIRARAENLGLLQPGQAVDESTLFDFIFQPGFTTAAELSQVAGRGVGMDVVKTEVAALGGRIEILSQAGQGTTFRLYLPLTLAVTQTLLVRVGHHLYAVPSTMIEQVMELKEKPLAALREKGEAEWQGNRYPFHFLTHLLGDTGAAPEMHRQYWVLLLRSGSQRVALQVDELKGNQEVVVKNIGSQLARVVGIAGATVLGDGQVVLILNPVALASRGGVALPGSAMPAELPSSAGLATLPTVMVVDDSLTVRKITSRLLAREGYEVVLAKDGVDALEQLLDIKPHVILSDIEMPRMDGFDLLRNIRGDARLADIPVVMITSRTADKHRSYAFSIGANHYLGKPYDEDELLGIVAGYCKKHS